MIADDFYRRKGRPVVAPSFCLVADLLGMKARVRSCRTPAESDSLCQIVYDLASSFKAECSRPPDGHPWSYLLISDMIILGYPITTARDLGEPELGDVVEFVQQFQIHMTLGGFLVRGGLSFGELHISDDHVFGKALVVAHLLEVNDAKWPRIVVSPQVEKLIDRHLQFYTDPGQAPHADAFLRDRDDKSVFVNYLDSTNYGEGTDLSMIGDHKESLLNRRREVSDAIDVIEKLDWACAYHNYFCSNRIVGSDEWHPSPQQVEELIIQGCTGSHVRFERLADRRSASITGKSRMPSPHDWAAFDE